MERLIVFVFYQQTRSSVPLCPITAIKNFETEMSLTFVFAEANRLTHEIYAHGGGRVVSASGSETSGSNSTPTSAIIYDVYTSIIKK